MIPLIPKRLLSYFSFFALSVFTLLPPSYAGHESSGGGNTIAGKPIESYAKDVESYSSFKNIVAPILANIEDVLPIVGSNMEDIATEKTWYFVPTKLQQLPSSVTGIQTNSDQTIVQTGSAVWVDTTEFPKNDQDQATLILHELLIGWDMRARQSDSLTPADHDAVRSITIYLLKNPNASQGEIISLFAQYGFPDYAVGIPGLISGAKPITTLYKFLQEANASQDSAEALIGYTPDDGSQVYCKNSYSFDDVNQVLTFSIVYHTVYRDGQTKDSQAFVAQASQFENWDGTKDGDLTYHFVNGTGKANIGEARRSFDVTVSAATSTVELHGAWMICRELAVDGSCDSWDNPSWKEAQNLNPSAGVGCALN